ncbi:YciI family protein [Aestuariimicrobium ganziense]|uniref:YciI family protein n=1 Tax=Aestuariimicrobium ganziense TaxID=2773677 RepID=UPI001943B4D0|nr:YciI family protein [Aestuariimicrobium ganziense]
MQFLMFVVTDPDHTAADVESAPDVEQWWTQLNDAGQWLAGDPLRPAPEARSVRVRGGEVLVTDGPYLESTEAIVGFDVIKAADIDEAIRIAAGHPMAWGGRIEVRPIQPIDEA